MINKSMLSILIPTRNYDCSELIRSLHRLCTRSQITFEIIVNDDASTDTKSVECNRITCSELSCCTFIHRDHNIGLASSRNKMAEVAKYDWLLFIDCDAQVASDGFIDKYVEAMPKCDAICGGLRHPENFDDYGRELRYRYERKADQRRAASERSKHPYNQLSTFNFLIRKSVFMSIRFDEDCKEYGYEDALFGVELMKRNIPLLHIDNPLIHTGIDTNEAFIRKSETALRTLYSLNGKMQGNSRVEAMADKVESMHLKSLALVLYRCFYSAMRRNLLGHKPSLHIFSLYKLGYFLNLKN